jgi:hypothetical protein
MISLPSLRLDAHWKCVESMQPLTTKSSLAN